MRYTTVAIAFAVGSASVAARKDQDKSGKSKSTKVGEAVVCSAEWCSDHYPTPNPETETDPETDTCSVECLDRYPTIDPIDNNSGYTTKSTGELGTDAYRLNFYKDQGTTLISPWHDIPLKGETDGTYNVVIEIPRMTTAKYEVNKEEAFNPIIQDIKNGKIRFYHGPIFWNYGMIPQTWENESKKVSVPGLDLPAVVGDDDPVDIVEVGSTALPTGTVAKVKILGALGLIDEGEMDWKIMTLKTDDPLSTEYDDIDDVPKEVRDGIREWFRWYKSPDGTVNHLFANSDEWYNKSVAELVIEGTHEEWVDLIQGNVPAEGKWIG